MSAGPSFAAGEESLRSILAVWRMEAECPPMTRPTLDELGPFEDDRAQRERDVMPMPRGDELARVGERHRDEVQRRHVGSRGVSVIASHSASRASVNAIGHKFSLGVADGDGVLRGVAMVGRPVARHYDDGLTLEVNRTATDGTANANSMLYGATWSAAKALGYQRVITYTHKIADELQALRLIARLWGHDFRYDGETGASLRAAGWRVVAERRERKGWTTPSRPRAGRGVDGIQRMLWEPT